MASAIREVRKIILFALLRLVLPPVKPGWKRTKRKADLTGR